jgi:hypothetical protein
MTLETAQPTAVAVPPDPATRKDLKTLALFIRVKTHDVTAIAGRELVLCESCRKLLAHAFVKRSHCPMHPKPACKHCPSHCYHPAYRAQIREVMRFSGRKMVLGGRLDYLFHLLF